MATHIPCAQEWSCKVCLLAFGWCYCILFLCGRIRSIDGTFIIWGWGCPLCMGFLVGMLRRKVKELGISWEIRGTGVCFGTVFLKLSYLRLLILGIFGMLPYNIIKGFAGAHYHSHGCQLWIVHFTTACLCLCVSSDSDVPLWSSSSYTKMV